MTFPKRLEDYRIIFFRSFYPDPVPQNARSSDERLLRVFELLRRTGLDTSFPTTNLRPTEKGLRDKDCLEHLGFLRQLEDIPCVFLLWVKREDEMEVLSFFARLERSYPSPLKDAPKIWFRESPGQPYLRCQGAQGESQTHVLALPYRKTHTDADMERLRQFLMVRRPPSRLMQALSPETVFEADIPQIPDVTVKVPAIDWRDPKRNK